MIGRTLRMVALGVAGLALVSGAIACNDDGADGGELSLEEYFQEVDRIDDEFEAASAELEGEFEELADDDLEGAVDLLEQQRDTFEDFVADLSELEPPAEAAEAHDDAVEGLDAFTQQFDDAIEAFSSADTIEDAFASLQEADFAQLEAANEACRELVQIATDNDITVALNCGDEEGS